MGSVEMLITVAWSLVYVCIARVRLGHMSSGSFQANTTPSALLSTATAYFSIHFIRTLVLGWQQFQTGMGLGMPFEDVCIW
jgi:hypothetical protein